eukprot:366569-Chlamydomonas_euryale.AAC.26
MEACVLPHAAPHRRAHTSASLTLQVSPHTGHFCSDALRPLPPLIHTNPLATIVTDCYLRYLRYIRYIRSKNIRVEPTLIVSSIVDGTHAGCIQLWPPHTFAAIASASTPSMSMRARAAAAAKCPPEPADRLRAGPKPVVCAVWRWCVMMHAIRPQTYTIKGIQA